ncbi:MAG: ribonuclease III, partial [Bacteroidales bacterium]|nr:ribonuclease III [Bacteroidales bacterium]
MKLFVQRDKEFRSALYDIMGFYPHDVELYRIAFAHKSQEYKSKRTGDRPLNNERLEFLGDAVLETVVSDIVYHHFKNKREGFLTNTRSKIVSRESLGKLAKDLGIDRLIQSHTNSKAHNSFLAGNAFEALMGAIYLDRGFDYAFRFIEHRIMGSVLDLEGVAHKEVNFKSKLLEWSQKNRIRIDFKDKQTSNGSGNAPSFFTTIVLEGLFAGDGKGFSKKEAHQNASKDALTRMRREPKFIDEIFTSKEKRTAMEADPCFVLPVIDEIEAEIARETERGNERKADRRAEQPKREQKPKSEPKKEQPKKEQPKAEPKKEQPKKDQPSA